MQYLFTSAMLLLLYAVIGCYTYGGGHNVAGIEIAPSAPLRHQPPSRSLILQAAAGMDLPMASHIPMKWRRGSWSCNQSSGNGDAMVGRSTAFGVSQPKEQWAITFSVPMRNFQ